MYMRGDPFSPVGEFGAIPFGHAFGGPTPQGYMRVKVRLGTGRQLRGSMNVFFVYWGSFCRSRFRFSDFNSPKNTFTTTIFTTIKHSKCNNHYQSLTTEYTNKQNSLIQSTGSRSPYANKQNSQDHDRQLNSMFPNDPLMRFLLASQFKDMEGSALHPNMFGHHHDDPEIGDHEHDDVPSAVRTEVFY